MIKGLDVYTPRFYGCFCVKFFQLYPKHYILSIYELHTKLSYSRRIKKSIFVPYA